MEENGEADRLARKVGELDVYRRAREVAREVFDLSQDWPVEETYRLRSQIRRSSRSVGAQIAEAWAKRRYPASFLAKLTDADAENEETGHWIATAEECGYLEKDSTTRLLGQVERIGRQLGAMMKKASEFRIWNTDE